MLNEKNKIFPGKYKLFEKHFFSKMPYYEHYFGAINLTFSLVLLQDIDLCSVKRCAKHIFCPLTQLHDKFMSFFMYLLIY